MLFFSDIIIYIFYASLLKGWIRSRAWRAGRCWTGGATSSASYNCSCGTSACSSWKTTCTPYTSEADCWGGRACCIASWDGTLNIVSLHVCLYIPLCQKRKQLVKEKKNVCWSIIMGIVILSVDSLFFVMYYYILSFMLMLHVNANIIYLLGVIKMYTLCWVSTTYHLSSITKILYISILNLLTVKY